MFKAGWGRRGGKRKRPEVMPFWPVGVGELVEVAGAGAVAPGAIVVPGAKLRYGGGGGRTSAVRWRGLGSEKITKEFGAAGGTLPSPFTVARFRAPELASGLRRLKSPQG